MAPLCDHGTRPRSATASTPSGTRPTPTARGIPHGAVSRTARYLARHSIPTARYGARHGIPHGAVSRMTRYPGMVSRAARYPARHGDGTVRLLQPSAPQCARCPTPPRRTTEEVHGAPPTASAAAMRCARSRGCGVHAADGGSADYPKCLPRTHGPCPAGARPVRPPRPRR